MDYDLNNPNDQWELKLDIYDFDLRLTPVLRPCSSTHVETSTTTQNPIRIIPGPAGIVQAAKLLKQRDIQEGGEECVMLTQEYIKKVVEDVGEDEGFKRGSRASAIEYVTINGGIVSGCLGDIKNFLKNGKLDQVVAIVKSCALNVLVDLTVTLKELSGTIGGSIHHKVINVRGYRNNITVGDALILANVSVFSPKPSMHYLNITMRNVVKVFRKDIVPRSGSGVCGNVNDEEDQYNLQIKLQMLNVMSFEWKWSQLKTFVVCKSYGNELLMEIAVLTQQSQAEFPQLDSSLVVPMFQQGEDPIECINKAMAFLFAVASRFPSSNKQLRTSSNHRNQATIQDGRVTVQQVQGRQNQSYAGIENRGITTTSKGNVADSPPRVVKCYNCQGEGHMARQCTQLNAWFKEKLMLAEAQEAGQILDEEQLAFLADPAVLMANLSSCDPEVLSVVPYSDSYPNDMVNQYVQEMQCSEQTHVDDFEDNEIHSGSNINIYLNQREKLIDSQMDDLIRDRNAKLAAFQQEIDTLKETLSNNVKEKESLSKTLTVFKTESKEKESKYIGEYYL
ncbi:copia protein [Tanacetum coccineum]